MANTLGMYKIFSRPVGMSFKDLVTHIFVWNNFKMGLDPAC